MTPVQGPDREERLNQMVIAYEKDLLRLCCMYLKDIDLAKDAVQETFLKAYRRMDRFEGKSSEKTWLMRIAVNVCHSMRRTGWVRFIDRCITLDKLPEPVMHADYGLSELMIDIMQLPRKLIDVVLLHDYQGFTTREIGEMLGIPYQTVISRLKTAHTKLRIALTDSEQEGGAPT